MRRNRSHTFHTTMLMVLMFLCIWQIAVCDDDPLRVEDVVRRFVQGESVESLLEQIRATTVDFTLDDEMLQELGIAGIPIELINAMAARQRELAPALQEVVGSGEDESRSNLILRLNPPRKSNQLHVDGGEISLQTVIDQRVANALGLRPDQTEFDDLAAYVQCRTADHVPDRWRSQTPLGRDFQGSRRHRMLLFHAGAEAADGKLTLRLPLLLELRLDEATNHRLTVGVAARVGENYLNLTAMDLDDVLIENGGTVEMLLRMENGKDQTSPNGLRVKRIRTSEKQE